MIFLFFQRMCLCEYPISNYFRISTSKLLKSLKSPGWQFVLLKARRLIEPQ